MTPARSIPADLHTPLSAYLRLRSSEGGSFLLESVERGLLGRNSFVGCGARLVGIDEVERLGVPAVGYLSYDYAAKLEPTVALPEGGPGFAESVFVVADTLLRFDHGAGVVEVLAGDPEELALRLEAPLAATDAPSTSPSGPIRRFPARSATRRWCAAARSTSSPATRTRSCPRSAPSDRLPHPRSRSIARSAA